MSRLRTIEKLYEPKLMRDEAGTITGRTSSAKPNTQNIGMKNRISQLSNMYVEQHRRQNET